MSIAELQYPKNMFDKELVLLARNEFERPDAWELSESENDWILRFHPDNL